MAELQDQSGGLVPTRAASGPRDLLPYELQLCEVVGITPEEYLYFQQLSDAYDGKRAEAYDLVPDVRNDATTLFIVNLVIGLALQAVSILLAPKLRGPKSLTTADIKEPDRFTTTVGFDSVQNLASLGETIPLAFANRKGDVGGIRVKALLLWSQLISQGIGQTLKAVMMLSTARLAAKPDFAGYAIGDQTLKNYTNSKIGLYIRLGGGRITESDRYPQGTIVPSPSADVFSIYDDGSESYQPWFSGTRSPTTQTKFGCFSAMPNGSEYKLNYELILIQANAGKKKDLRIKQEKLKRSYATRAAISSVTGDRVTYVITGGQEDRKAYPPWGLDDVNAVTEDVRIAADDQIQIGGLYMAGSIQVTCIKASTENIWLPEAEKTFTFAVEEPGSCDVQDPLGINGKPYGDVLQRLLIGNVANSRACNITEIGIKSTVWKQINGFSNVNSQPSDEVIKSYERADGSIQLGSVQRYHKRLSFFRLQVRKLGSDSLAWTDISGGKLFCIEGNTTQAKYNYLRISQPYGQYEYRLVPVPGGTIYKEWRFKSVYFLGGLVLHRYSVGNFAVSFNATVRSLTITMLSNPDWLVGTDRSEAKGVVENFMPRTAGGGEPIRRETRLDFRNFWIQVTGSTQYLAYWDGVDVTGNPSFYKGLAVIDSFPKPPTAKPPAQPLPPFSFRVFHQIIKILNEGVVPAGTTTVAVTGGSGTGMTVRVDRYSNGALELFLVNGGTGYVNRETVWVNVYGGSYPIVVTTDEESLYLSETSLNPYDAIADYPLYTVERTSNQSNPEHEIVYVNEQIVQVPPNYDDLAIVGVRLASTREWSSFAQLSAYVQKGIVVERLIDDDGNPVNGMRGPTNNLAEIVYALLTDDRIGAGSNIGKSAVNRERMTLAARFCHANGFTWDGVISDRLNLRQWIFEQAGYCLLDFTILGGQFSLVPSVPYGSDFKIANNAKVPISALFTDGNIRNLKVSWLSPEERQLFKAVVKWRQENLNGFSQERMFTMRLSDAQGGRDDDPEESFDISKFSTTQEHGMIFARYALKIRQLVDHALTFETTPQAAMGLEPGQYIKLVSEVTHTSRFNNGVINSDGTVIATTAMPDGGHQILYWVPGTTEVQEATLTVAGGVAQQVALRGVVFTLKNSTTTKRVYKVETLSMGEDGFVEVAASYQPTTDSGALSTLQWSNDDFVVQI